MTSSGRLNRNAAGVASASGNRLADWQCGLVLQLSLPLSFCWQQSGFCWVLLIVMPAACIGQGVRGAAKPASAFNGSSRQSSRIRQRRLIAFMLGSLVLALDAGQLAVVDMLTQDG